MNVLLEYAKEVGLFSYNINLFTCAIKLQNEATKRKKLKRQYVFFGWKICQLHQFENYCNSFSLLDTPP